MAEVSQDNSIDDILSDIKNVITGVKPDAEDVVVLTERVDNENEPPKKEFPVQNQDSAANDDAPNDISNDASKNESTLKAENKPKVAVNDAKDSEDENGQIPAIDSLSEDFHEEKLKKSRTLDSEDSLIKKSIVDVTRSIVNDAKAKTNPSKSKEQWSPLEERLIEIMRPEISNWLNQYLPSIVREVVEKEIKKVIGNE